MAARIAVINDDTAFLQLMCQLLTEEGYEAHIFREGEGCYPAVRALRPDAIILDIRLERPETGWTVLELLKLDRELTTMPIIICSADLLTLQARAAFLKSKGCEILPKPFDLDDLLTLLERLLRVPG